MSFRTKFAGKGRHHQQQQAQRPSRPPERAQAQVVRSSCSGDPTVAASVSVGVWSNGATRQALPIRPCGRKASTHDHDQEGQHDGIGRRSRRTRTARPVRSAARPAPLPEIEPMPPTITTTSEASRNRDVLSGGNRLETCLRPRRRSRQAPRRRRRRRGTPAECARPWPTACPGHPRLPGSASRSRVRFSSNHMPNPMATAARKITMRTIGYFR